MKHLPILCLTPAAACLFVLACGSGRSASDTPTVAPTTTADPTPSVAVTAWKFQHITAFDFIDVDHGWLALDDMLLRTENGGETWSLASRLNGLTFSLSLVSESEGWGVVDGNVLHSVDAGVNWSSAGPPDLSASGIVFLDGERGWVWSRYWQGNEGQLFKTTDGGATWESIATPCSLSAIFSFFSAQEGVALCGDQQSAGSQLKEIHRTEDGGVTWHLVARNFLDTGRPGKPVAPTTGYLAGLSFFDESVGLMSLNRAGIGHTADGGESWQGLFPEEFLGLQPDGTGFGDVQLLSPTEGYVVCGWQQSVLARTRDGGQTWTDVSPPSD